MEVQAGLKDLEALFSVLVATLWYI